MWRDSVRLTELSRNALVPLTSKGESSKQEVVQILNRELLLRGEEERHRQTLYFIKMANKCI